MKKTENSTIPYSNRSYATEPTKMVKFVRSCFIIQIFSFFKLNLKVMKIIVKGHS